MRKFQHTNLLEVVLKLYAFSLAGLSVIGALSLIIGLVTGEIVVPESAFGTY